MGENWPETPSADHMIEFTLKVKCSHNAHALKGSRDPEQLYSDSQGEHHLNDCHLNYKCVVTTSAFKWVPIGNQAQKVWMMVGLVWVIYLVSSFLSSDQSTMILLLPN